MAKRVCLYSLVFLFINGLSIWLDSNYLHVNDYSKSDQKYEFFCQSNLVVFAFYGIYLGIIGPIREEFSFRYLGLEKAKHKPLGLALLLSIFPTIIILTVFKDWPFKFSSRIISLIVYGNLLEIVFFLLIFSALHSQPHFKSWLDLKVSRHLVPTKIILTVLFSLVHGKVHFALINGEILRWVWNSWTFMLFSFFAFDLYKRFHLRASIYFHMLLNLLVVFSDFLKWLNVHGHL